MADHNHDVPPLDSKQQDDQQPEQAILRKIASYLSLGDAESMASLSRPSPRYCYSAATPRHHGNGIANNSHNSPGLTGYHSLDYHFDHTIGTASAGGELMDATYSNNLRRGGDDDGIVSLLGSNSSVGAAAVGQRQYHPQISPSSFNNTNTTDDEEDWFVGGKGQTPGLVALSPLEEEFDAQQQQHLQHPINSTPAGQPTSESEGVEPSRMGYVTNTSTSGILRRNNSRQSRWKMTDSNNMNHEDDHSNTHDVTENDDDDDLSIYVRRENSLRRKALQRKLAAAIFAHPYPLRQYCLDAYGTAMKLSMERQRQQEQLTAQSEESERYLEDPPETAREPVPTSVSPSTDLHGLIDSSPELGEHTQQQLRGTGNGGGNQQLQQQHRHRHHQQQEKRLHKQRQSRAKIIRVIITKLLNNAPLSILLDIAESVCDLSLETLFAAGKIGLFTIDKAISILCNTVLNILDVLTSFNPFHIFEHVINLQRSAVGKTGDVVVSGIMSVATGVGSVSNAALNRLSRQGLALAGGVVIAGTGSRSGRSGSHDHARKDASSGDNALDSKVSATESFSHVCSNSKVLKLTTLFLFSPHLTAISKASQNGFCINATCLYREIGGGSFQQTLKETRSTHDALLCVIPTFHCHDPPQKSCHIKQDEA